MFSSLRSLLPIFAMVASLAPVLGQLVVTPLLPSVDPFYVPPSGYGTHAPGTILRTRQVATSYLGLIPDGVQAWQLLYHTTAINGSAIASVTTVFKPLVAKEDRFVSFHTAYDGAARSGVCDPSYNYHLGAPQVDLISSVEFLLLQAFVLDGYIVSSPDYEGPDAAFGAGRLAGTGVLNSMRAIVNIQKTLGLSTATPQIVGYGYSGGAIATGWAASLQPSYAPELVIKGWAQGGTPANLTGTAELIDGTLFAGFLPQSLVGLSAPSAYGAELQPVIESIITAYGQSALDTAEQICGVENLITFAFQQIQATSFQRLGDQVFHEPTFAAVLQQTIMGLYANETPTAPVYMFHASRDEIIPYANASTLYTEWCHDGASVQFVTFAAGGHATTEVIGFPGAFQFVEAAFSGTVASGCSQVTELSDTLDPLALGVELEPILVQLLNALAIAGRKDVNIRNNLGALNKTAGA